MAISNTKNNSFGRQFRLKGRSAFLGVLLGKTSKRLRGRWCELIIVTSDVEAADRKSASMGNEAATRFGIAVTRKAGDAVRRNRLKRIVREFLRTHKGLWATRPDRPEGRLIVIRISRPVIDEADLLAELEDMLKSAQ